MIKIDAKTALIIGLAVGWAYDTKVAIKNKKTFNTVKTERDDLQTLVIYMEAKLDEYNVPMTDFDRIVVNNLAHVK